MLRKTTARLEILEHRHMLAGDIPTFDDGVFALPGSADELATFEIRRTDADLTSDDKTTLVGFVPDDGNGALDNLFSNESYEVKSIARARKRIVYFGDEASEFKLKGAAFLSFVIIKEAGVTEWLRTTTRQEETPDLGFLFPVAEHDLGSVRALGNQAWEIRWGEAGNTYTYELQLNSTELDQEVLIESFVNSDSADDAPGLAVQAGEFVSRNFTVTNPGSVALINVVVTDDNGTPDDESDDFSPVANLLANGFNLGDLDADGELDPGEVWLYSSPHTAAAGQFSSRTVVRAEANGSSVEAFDTANYFASTADVIDIALVEATSAPAPIPGGDSGDLPLYKSGESYAFRPVVRNVGNVEVDGPFEVQVSYRGTVSLTSASETLAPNGELALPPIDVLEAEEGTFPIEFRFDPGELIEESDESAASNVLATDLVFAKPDLSVVDFAAVPTPLDRSEVGEAPSYDLGQTYELSPIIVNTGSLPVAGPFEVEISYQEQSVLVTGDQELLPGETLILDPICIEETEEGDFDIIFTFDPNGLLDESDESEESNSFTAQLRFR